MHRQFTSLAGQAYHTGLSGQGRLVITDSDGGPVVDSNDCYRSEIYCRDETESHTRTGYSCDNGSFYHPGHDPGW